MKKFLGSTFSILLLSASMFSYADSSSGLNGVYFEGSYGRSDLDDPEFELDKEKNLAITVGYQFTQNFAIELGYTDYDEFTDSEIPGVDVDFAIKGYNLALVGAYPINEKLSFYGKAGVMRSNVEVDVDVQGLDSANIADDDENDLQLALGASYKITDNFSATLQFQRIKDLNIIGVDDDLDTFSLGFRYGL